MKVFTKQVFTAVSAGNSVQFRASSDDKFPVSYGVSVRQIGGTGSTWIGALQISLDEVNYVDNIIGTEANDGQPVFSPDNTRKPSISMRYNLSAFTPGTDVTGLEVTLIATS